MSTEGSPAPQSTGHAAAGVLPWHRDVLLWAGIILLIVTAIVIGTSWQRLEDIRSRANLDPRVHLEHEWDRLGPIAFVLPYFLALLGGLLSLIELAAVLKVRTVRALMIFGIALTGVLFNYFYINSGLIQSFDMLIPLDATQESQLKDEAAQLFRTGQLNRFKSTNTPDSLSVLRSAFRNRTIHSEDVLFVFDRGVQRDPLRAQHDRTRSITPLMAHLYLVPPRLQARSVGTAHWIVNIDRRFEEHPSKAWVKLNRNGQREELRKVRVKVWRVDCYDMRREEVSTKVMRGDLRALDELILKLARRNLSELELSRIEVEDGMEPWTEFSQWLGIDKADTP